MCYEHRGLYSVVVMLRHWIVVVSWRHCRAKPMISNNPAILRWIRTKGDFGTDVARAELGHRKVDNAWNQM